MNGLPAVSLDLSAYPGVDFTFKYQIDGLDFTDATSVMSIKGLADFAVQTTALLIGVNDLGVYDLDVVGSVTTAWSPGVYPYTIITTWPDASEQLLLRGSIVVFTP